MSSQTKMPATGATRPSDLVRQGLTDPEVARSLMKLTRAALGRFPAGITLAQRDGEAEEMFQQVSMLAIESAHLFDPERGSLVHWLGGITWNVARQRRPARCAATEPGLLEEAIYDRGGSIPDDVAHRVDSSEILERLPSADALLLKRYAEGWTSQEIADELHMKPGNVRVRLSRLKGHLQGLCRDADPEAAND